jgi:hypothetical protein
MADIRRWEEFVEEGNELYNYMINNFNDMIDDKSILHFDVEIGTYNMISHVDDIKKKYFYDIQKEIIPWIKREGKDLFKYDNWIPFRDPDVLTIMFLGYRKMFQFKQYIFQLTMRLVCDSGTCEDCKLVDYISTIHFRVALYGWREENKVNIQPTDLYPLLQDNIMPDSSWFYERKFCTGK